MFKGKKEPKDLIIGLNQDLNKRRAEADIMLSYVKDYNERRLLERLIDSIERSKDDVRRNTSESDYRLRSLPT